uniref:proline--tRNA ligase n=1 Tax=Biomphalaria glabrata TaxID=6526 RepID=A0A2C9M5B6_BIOGL
MSHGDNRGIIIPPMIAPNQIDIIEVFGNKNPEVHKVANKLYKELGRKYRVRLDASDKGPGFKAGKSEIEGTPLRLEVGPRDLEQGLVTFVRRDTLEKIQVKLEDVKKESAHLLKLIQADLYTAAEKRVNANIVHASSYEEMKRLIVEEKRFVVVPYSVTSAEVEKKFKAEFGATARCIPQHIKTDKPLKCIIT